MKLVRFGASIFLAFGFLLIPTSAFAAMTGPVNITCQSGETQGTYQVGWDNSNQFFADKGNIAALYCEGGFSPLGFGATYVSDDLQDESLRYYGGVIPEPTPEPTPTPEVTPTPDPEPTLEPTPSPEPSPTPEPEPSPQPGSEGTSGQTPEQPSSPSPAPEEQSPSDPQPPVVSPEPSPEPQPIPSEPPVVEPTPEPAPEPSPEAPEPAPSPEPTPEPLEPSEPPLEPSEPQSTEELVAEALEALETAQKGSEEYLEALAALAEAAQADDPELPSELAAIPLLGDVAGAVLEVFNDLGNVGADMSPQVREQSEEVIIAAVIVGQIALTATSVTSITRK